VLLAFKLVLVPLLIATVTLGTRRWGPRVGGFLTALPIVTGPTLCFYAIEQGAPFASRASAGTLLALVAVVVFCLTYARLSKHAPWPATLVGGWIAFLITVAVLYRLPQSAWFGLAAVIAASAAAYRALPAQRVLPPPPKPPAWDLPLRMTAAAALVIILTSVAAWLGPNLSGLLTPFPLSTAILAAFTHAQRGHDAVASFFHGFVPALGTFAVFCFVLSLTLPVMSIALAVVCALSAQLVLQAGVFRVMAL
jgi:hypothetical protein